MVEEDPAGESEPLAQEDLDKQRFRVEQKTAVYLPDGSRNPDYQVELTCLWEDDCRAPEGCDPKSCVWVHEEYEAEPRCYGRYQGRFLLPRDHPDIEVARRHCAECLFGTECADYTYQRMRRPPPGGAVPPE